MPGVQMIAIADPGEGIAAQKGLALAEEAGKLGIAPGNAVHVDNSFKYDVQAVVLGASGFHTEPAMKRDFDYMVSHCCGSPPPYK